MFNFNFNFQIGIPPTEAAMEEEQGLRREHTLRETMSLREEELNAASFLLIWWSVKELTYQLQIPRIEKTIF